MNQLIAMNVEMTMSSREIAELVEKRPDNVKRTIETLARKGLISKPRIEDGVRSANGVIEKLYMVNQRDSYVIVAQLSPEFTARLVDRWQELEAKAKPRVPQTYAAALLEAGRLAAELEQKHELVISKGEPQTLTQLVGRAAVRGANSWLLAHGYVTTSVVNGWRVWFLTEKGKEFGVQTKERNLRWAVELLDILPPQHELLERY